MRSDRNHVLIGFAMFTLSILGIPVWMLFGPPDVPGRSWAILGLLGMVWTNIAGFLIGLHYDGASRYWERVRLEQRPLLQMEDITLVQPATKPGYTSFPELHVKTLGRMPGVYRISQTEISPVALRPHQPGLKTHL